MPIALTAGSCNKLRKGDIGEYLKGPNGLAKVEPTVRFLAVEAVTNAPDVAYKALVYDGESFACVAFSPIFRPGGGVPAGSGIAGLRTGGAITLTDITPIDHDEYQAIVRAFVAVHHEDDGDVLSAGGDLPASASATPQLMARSVSSSSAMDIDSGNDDSQCTQALVRERKRRELLENLLVRLSEEHLTFAALINKVETLAGDL